VILGVEGLINAEVSFWGGLRPDGESAGPMRAKSDSSLRSAWPDQL